MKRSLTEMITRGQRRLDEMPLENPNWRDDADHEMGEEGEYQDALSQHYPGREEEQADYFETPRSWVDPVADDVEFQGMVDADAELDSASYDDDWIGDAAAELEQQEDESGAYSPMDDIRTGTSASEDRWGKMAGVTEGEDDEEDSSGDVEAGEDEKGGWSTTKDGRRVNIPS